ncbi:TRAP transporter large permease [Parvularcula marina]|uniref:TRAP transporter large permease protein n=1 Tax=Parvularcula marina TaxID=2292771 RepID=A0A371REG2_9PROT|nr:TRAP transporter large permease [Parvularcula marina]RFB03841.1 TRAP transporter large permease [Parvularcula marina]
MELVVLLLSLLGLLAIGVPVAFALLIASMVVFALLGLNPLVAVQRLSAGIDVFTLMAVPFFVFAGDLMTQTGIATRLIRVAEGLFGRVRGGLGHVNVGASMMFGAVSGSAIASVSAIGSTMIPIMEEKGYDRSFSVNVTSAAAILGLIIPPSHNMIIYAAASGISISIGDLFVAGILPGLLCGLALMITVSIIAAKKGYPKGVFPGFRALLYSAIAALPGLMTAVIIVVGILGGVFTPTESSAIAIIYTLIIGLLVYRTLGIRQFRAAVVSSAKTTSMIMLIIGAAAAFGWLLALLEAPRMMSDFILGLTDSPFMILALILLCLLLLGTFMDMAPLIIIVTPIFLPVVQSIGVDPVHFGIIMMLALGIGTITPPVGTVLFVASAVGKMRVEDTVKTMWPFYLALLICLLIVTYVPQISLLLVGS